MRILKRSTRRQPRISIILLDWGVRESFHLLHYLKNQTVARDDFEVLLIEYYSGISKPLQVFESEIDTWILLEMPDDCYYHKHLMYNAGIVLGKGDILMIADSDAMVTPRFLETVLQAFDRDPLQVYHMDEFRNVRRDFYPFNYPSFEEVLGDGCINNESGKTKGVLDQVDSMHSRNYGACMCARRDDVLAIGGADEDLTYLGHICGPYDMTFRLMHSGLRLRWETEEYLYHTWHPGSDGVDNYLGPHDGRNMSTTAFQALCSGRVQPLMENQAIQWLRTGRPLPPLEQLAAILIDPNYAAQFSRRRLGASPGGTAPTAAANGDVFASYHGFNVYCIGKSFYGVPQELGPVDPAGTRWRSHERVIEAASFNEICRWLDDCEAELVETAGAANICRVGRRFAAVPQHLGQVDFRIRSHREDPQIRWSETLAEARAAAQRIPPPEGSSVDRPAVLPQPAVAFGSFLTPQQRIAALEQRLAAVEAGLGGMLRSRTWRGLTSIGGLLLKPATLFRPRRREAASPRALNTAAAERQR